MLTNVGPTDRAVRAMMGVFFLIAALLTPVTSFPSPDRVLWGDPVWDHRPELGGYGNVSVV